MIAELPVSLIKLKEVNVTLILVDDRAVRLDILTLASGGDLT